MKIKTHKQYKFTETLLKQYERLTTNPPNIWRDRIYGLSLGKLRTMRRVLIERMELKDTDKHWMSADDFKKNVNCPYWMADLSLEDIFNALEISIYENFLTPKQ